MSRILKYFQVAYSNLIRQKTRTFLTVFAMAIGIASLVVIITIYTKLYTSSPQRKPEEYRARCGRCRYRKNN